MKKVFRGMLLLVVIGVLIGSTASAGPLKTEIDITVGSVGSADTLTSAFISDPFPLPGTDVEMGYTLSVYVRDTVGSANVAADSLVFRLVRQPDGAQDLDSTSVASGGSGWITVYSFAAAKCNASAFPISKHIPLDSAAVYPIGPGVYAWMVYGGIGHEGHYPAKAYKYDAFIEYKGAF